MTQGILLLEAASPAKLWKIAKEKKKGRRRQTRTQERPPGWETGFGPESDWPAARERLHQARIRAMIRHATLAKQNLMFNGKTRYCPAPVYFWFGRDWGKWDSPSGMGVGCGYWDAPQLKFAIEHGKVTGPIGPVVEYPPRTCPYLAPRLTGAPDPPCVHPERPITSSIGYLSARIYAEPLPFEMGDPYVLHELKRVSVCCVEGLYTHSSNLRKQGWKVEIHLDDTPEVELECDVLFGVKPCFLK